MHFQWLTEQLPSDEILATVVMDASRDTEGADRAVAARWGELRRYFDGQDISPAVVAVLEEQVLKPTGRSGRHGRLIVAAEDGIRLDRTLLFPPRKDEAVLSVGPHMFALAREADDTVRYLLVEVDRSGADITMFDSMAGAIGGGPSRESVEGSHDVLNKVRAGGLSHKRIESRVEDSWERNAESVATELDRIVAERRPEMLIVTGDVRAVALVQSSLGGAASEITEHVPGGGRTDGVHESFDTKVDEVVEDFRQRRRAGTVERYRAELGKNALAVTGINRVIDALRKAQVEELLVSDAAVDHELSELKVWVGDKPLELSMHRDEIRQLSSGDARARRGDLALGAAVAAQDGGITLVYDDSVELTDGVGAILRWDPSRPSSVVDQQ